MNEVLRKLNPEGMQGLYKAPSSKQQPTAERRLKTKRKHTCHPYLGQGPLRASATRSGQSRPPPLRRQRGGGPAGGQGLSRAASFREKTKLMTHCQKKGSIQEVASAKAVKGVLRAVEGPELGKRFLSPLISSTLLTICTTDVNRAMFPINKLTVFFHIDGVWFDQNSVTRAVQSLVKDLGPAAKGQGQNRNVTAHDGRVGPRQTPFPGHVLACNLRQTDRRVQDQKGETPKLDWGNLSIIRVYSVSPYIYFIVLGWNKKSLAVDVESWTSLDNFILNPEDDLVAMAKKLQWFGDNEEEPHVGMKLCETHRTDLQFNVS